jgi:hypothetical protein
MACKVFGLNRTKMFHVKQFGTIWARNRTKVGAVSGAIIIYFFSGYDDRWLRAAAYVGTGGAITGAISGTNRRVIVIALAGFVLGFGVVALAEIAPSGYAVDRATVRQKKTGQPVRFELTEQTRQAVDDYLRAAAKKPGEFMFIGRRGSGTSITTRQYARLVSGWIASIGLDPHLFGTHSLRRTKATLIYRRTGNLRAVQLLLGHTKIESTVRYLGIEVDDALAIAEQVDV